MSTRGLLAAGIQTRHVLEREDETHGASMTGRAEESSRVDCCALRCSAHKHSGRTGRSYGHGTLFWRHPPLRGTRGSRRPPRPACVLLVPDKIGKRPKRLEEKEPCILFRSLALGGSETCLERDEQPRIITYLCVCRQVKACMNALPDAMRVSKSNKS